MTFNSEEYNKRLQALGLLCGTQIFNNRLHHSLSSKFKCSPHRDNLTVYAKNVLLLLYIISCVLNSLKIVFTWTSMTKAGYFDIFIVAS